MNLNKSTKTVYYIFYLFIVILTLLLILLFQAHTNEKKIIVEIKSRLSSFDSLLEISNTEFATSIYWHQVNFLMKKPVCFIEFFLAKENVVFEIGEKTQKSFLDVFRSVFFYEIIVKGVKYGRLTFYIDKRFVALDSLSSNKILYFVVIILYGILIGVIH